MILRIGAIHSIPLDIAVSLSDSEPITYLILHRVYGHNLKVTHMT